MRTPALNRFKQLVPPATPSTTGEAAARLGATDAAQLQGAWRQLQRQYPQLTQRTRFQISPRQMFEGTTTEFPGSKTPDMRVKPLISMGVQDSHGYMSPDAARNDYAVAHELGHANERYFIHGAGDADLYTRLANQGVEAAITHPTRDQFGMPTNYGEGSDPGEVAPNELYAADFAGALGRKWPDGTQIGGTPLTALQLAGLLPKGAGYGVGASPQNFPITREQSGALAQNYQRMFRNMPQAQYTNRAPTQQDNAMMKFLQAVAQAKSQAAPGGVGTQTTTYGGGGARFR